MMLTILRLLISDEGVRMYVYKHYIMTTHVRMNINFMYICKNAQISQNTITALNNMECSSTHGLGQLRIITEDVRT